MFALPRVISCPCSYVLSLASPRRFETRIVNPVSAWSEKRTLQTCVVLAGLVAVWAGAWGVLHDLGGHGGGLASHERYLSGLLLAIGLAFWTTVSDIEDKMARFRLLTALVVVGGISRLLGVALGDTLSWPIGGALAMELLLAPLLCLWQGRVDARFPDAGG
jgi:Domain of unknown function (DUF4345)